MTLFHNNAVVPNQLHSAASTLKNDMGVSSVSSVFFSQFNVDTLHEAIRYLVYKYSKCKHIISRQSDQELQIIMKSVFMENSKNLEYNIVEQVRDLNTWVLDFCVPRILREINMFIQYRREALQNPTPIERPVQTSTAGTKTLEFKRM